MDDLSEETWNKMLKGCVKCKMHPISLVEGPTGGLCINVFCSNCGQGYNIAPMMEMAQLIHCDEKYIMHERYDIRKPNPRGT
jgi:hypothetical protein